MILGSLIGAGASLVGGIMNRNSARDAAEAMQFQPFNVAGPGGTSTFDGNTLNLTLDPTSAAARDMAMNRGVNALMPVQGAQDMRTTAINQMPGLFQQAQNVPMGIGAANQQLQQQLGGLGGLFTGAGTAGMGAAFGTPTAAPFTQGLFGQGQQLMGSDFRDIEAAELQRQRDLARPGEERAVASAMDNLFSSGRLGTTGGAQQMGELALSQELADLQRVGQARGFANTLQQQDRQLGQNLFGLGLQGLQTDINRGLSLGQLGSGLLSQAPGVFGQQFEAQNITDQALQNRAQQRMANAESLFGFGAGVENMGINQANALFNMGQGFGADLRQQAGMGLQGGAAAAAAGRNAAPFIMAGNQSPFASAVQGFAQGGGFGGLDRWAGNQFNRLRGLFGGSGVVGV